MNLIELKDYKIEGKFECNIIDTIHFGRENGNDKDVLYIIPSLDTIYISRLYQDHPSSKFINTSGQVGYIFKHFKHDAIYLPLNAAVYWLKRGTSPVLYNMSLGDEFDEDTKFLNTISITHRMVKSFLGYAKRDSQQALDLLVQNSSNISKKILSCRVTNKKIAFSINYYDRALDLLSLVDCRDAIKSYKIDKGLPEDEQVFKSFIPRNNQIDDILKNPNVADYNIIEDLGYKDRILLLNHIIENINDLYMFIIKYKNLIKYEVDNTKDMEIHCSRRKEMITRFTTKLLIKDIDNIDA